MSTLTQFCPPSPTFTPTSLPPSLSPRVYLITGATSGVGLSLAQMLYACHATVYLAARSPSNITAAISSLRAACPDSRGRLEALPLDLSDLSTVAPAARSVVEREERLDGLVLNAGVMVPAEGTAAAGDVTGTASEVGGSVTEGSGSRSVRVVWLASTLQIGLPKGVIAWDEERTEPRVLKSQMENYMMSKVGNVFLAQDTARRLGSKGVLSVAVNPGFIKTELQRHMPAPVSAAMGMLFKGPEYGAYSELFGLLSPEVTPERNGAFVIPWGRFGALPENVRAAMKTEDGGGTGVAGS
ncbi:short-chain dehydrogenase [Purpureocillium lilacinum]|uniref:Short-chain dehydrogenase n=1 Tax=Purpureocillium lilacinum TaxID=33203 RepID=A0A179GXH4_PURLI|nr:short-chain dehydrogenase [Purpureocillium lilacinum]OAQ82667.1 short-chain dehydrogenase [Purpureocillium lilacinum]